MWRESFISKKYLISDSGEVKGPSGKILSVLNSKCGYKKVYAAGRQIEVHQLVARAYPEICGEWYEGCQVNHLDEDKANNAASNLRIVSAKENCRWGTRGERLKEAGSGIKKRVYQYDEDGELVGWYDSQTLAAKFLGLRQTTISRCLHGTYKTAGGYKWSYNATA